MSSLTISRSWFLIGSLTKWLKIDLTFPVSSNTAGNCWQSTGLLNLYERLEDPMIFIRYLNSFGFFLFCNFWTITSACSPGVGSPRAGCEWGSSGRKTKLRRLFWHCVVPTSLKTSTSSWCPPIACIARSGLSTFAGTSGRGSFSLN